MSEPKIDPIKQFSDWYDDAIVSEKKNPDAMALATVSSEGVPSVRMVLLKGYGEDGFVFYTNMESKKAQDLKKKPLASLCFYWRQLGRQVRIDGSVMEVTDEEADLYFSSRSRGSQISAWASDQSKLMKTREEFEEKAAQFEKKFASEKVFRPSFWSGYRLKPSRIEFWTEKDDRMHARLLFELTGQGHWNASKLYP